MYRFWNGKLFGLLGGVLLVTKRILNKILRVVLSTIYKSNLGFVGKNVTIFPGFKYSNPKSIQLQDNVIIGQNVTLSNGEINSGCIILEKCASIDFNCFIDYSGNIVMHKNAHIAWGAYISTHDHGYDYHAKPIGKSLEIGENAFIGAKSTILHNCNRIGKNAVIGTGSVVTKDVPDNAIVAGNPARIIKYRDDI